MKPEQVCISRAMEYFQIAESLLERNMWQKYKEAQCKAVTCLELAEIFISGSQGVNP